MKTSTQGLMEIASHEGIVQMPYRDSVGVWTWGIGLTKAAGQGDPAKMPKGVEIPLDKVLRAFQAALTKYEDAVNRNVRVSLKQYQYDALVSFTYNLGEGNLKRSQLLKRLNAGDYAGAASGFMGWTKPPEIIGRRKKEQALFASGKYSSGGFANVYPATTSGKVLWSQGKRMDLRRVFDVPASPPPPDIPAPKPKPPPPIDEPDVIDTEPAPPGGLSDSKGTSTMYAILRNVVGLLIFAGIGAFIAYKMFGFNVLDLIR